MTTNKKVLVAATDYPDNNGKVTLMYIHVRNMYYQDHGVNVTVLNFSAEKDYEIDGISVITLDTYKIRQAKYDILICHAANLRNHYRFLKKYGNDFPKFIFFFHGHEVLKINEAYSKPYDYVRSSTLKKFAQNVYDDYKLFVWRKYYPRVTNKSTFVFVSQWMLDEFLKWTKIPFEVIKENYMITYNCIGMPFEKATYDYKKKKHYDFVTVRGNLDGSKYSVDIVNDLAKNNLDMRFLLIGKGDFFNHYIKADNLEWRNQTMNHKEIIDVLNDSRCALMPTRTDAQGLMMCEMASTGIPLITSDIPVCHEVFDEFKNVTFIDNQDMDVDLASIISTLEANEPYEKNGKYYNHNTSKAEVDLIQSLLRKS